MINVIFRNFFIVVKPCDSYACIERYCAKCVLVGIFASDFIYIQLAS